MIRNSFKYTYILLLFLLKNKTIFSSSIIRPPREKRKISPKRVQNSQQAKQNHTIQPKQHTPQDLQLSLEREEQSKHSVSCCQDGIRKRESLWKENSKIRAAAKVQVDRTLLYHQYG